MDNMDTELAKEAAIYNIITRWQKDIAGVQITKEYLDTLELELEIACQIYINNDKKWLLHAKLTAALLKHDTALFAYNNNIPLSYAIALNYSMPSPL